MDRPRTSAGPRHVRGGGGHRHTWRVKLVFAWAAANEVIEPSPKNTALADVAALRKGTPGVRDTEKTKPVPEAAVEAVLPFLSDHLRAMVRLQQLTGMRSTELCTMRGADIDTSRKPGADPAAAAVWMYQPKQHKTAHHDIARNVPLGPKARAVIEPFLKADLSAFLFSPAEAEAQRRERQRDGRKTPVQPSQVKRSASARGRHRLRAPGERYDWDTYRRAIARACELAFPPPPELDRQRVPGRGRRKVARWESDAEWQARLGPEGLEQLQAWREKHDWHPHQLRHNFGTMIRSRFGADKVGVMLGDESERMVEVYAEKDLEVARQIAAQVG